MPTQNDVHQFLYLAQRYIHQGQPAKAWQAARVAARIAQERHDQWQTAACVHVVELCEQLNYSK